MRETVVAELGKAFAPDQIRFVTALPKTRSAKIVRRAVRAAVLGEDPGDLSSLEDPDVLAQLRRRFDLTAELVAAVLASARFPNHAKGRL